VLLPVGVHQALTPQQIFHRLRHFFQLVEQFAEVLLAVQSLLVVRRAHFHQ